MGRVSSCKQQHQHHIQRARTGSFEKRRLSERVHGVHVCPCPKKLGRLVHGTGPDRLQQAKLPVAIVPKCRVNELASEFLGPDRPDPAPEIVPQLSVTLPQQIPVCVRMDEHPTKT